jgi:DNA processing protein
MDRELLIAWTALGLVPAFTPRDARRATECWPDPARIAFETRAEEMIACGVGPAAAAALIAARPSLKRRARNELDRAVRAGIRIVARSDPDYPAEAGLLDDPPPVLYLRGELPAGTPRIAVVGARRATAYGRRVATALSADLADRGVEVLSGGARGIDTCAHLGALERKGRTVAVLGSGFLRPYPEENETLFERISREGCVLSEFPLDTGPRPEHFPRRNRLIASLAAAVVVVEAAVKSGSLITARHALDLGREVLAVPGPVHSEQSEGCHRLIRDGAALVRRAEDVLEEIPPMYRDAIAPAPAASVSTVPPLFGRLNDDERAVWALFSDDPEAVHIDVLAERAAIGFTRLQVALFGLVVAGAVEQLAGGYYLPRSSARPKN